MSTDVEIRRTVRAIIDDLDRALAYYETYVPTGQDVSLINRINAGGFHPAFNIISDALHINAILALCRIWDGKKGTANLSRLANKIRRSAAELARAGHTIDQQRLDKWLSAIEAGNKSSELLALRRVRNRALAHRADPNEEYNGKARPAVFGDERKVLETTIPLVIEAGRFIGIVDRMPFSDQRKVRQEHAKNFWDQIAPSNSQ